MNREKTQIIRKALEQVLQEHLLLHEMVSAVQVEPRAVYSSKSATFKIVVSDDAQVSSVNHMRFKQHARQYGFDPEEDYNALFEHCAEHYRVVGIAPNNRKYPVLAERVTDGKVFKFEAMPVKDAIDGNRKFKHNNSYGSA